jgi:hypothetical protein
MITAGITGAGMDPDIMGTGPMVGGIDGPGMVPPRSLGIARRGELFLCFFLI